MPSGLCESISPKGGLMILPVFLAEYSGYFSLVLHKIRRSTEFLLD